MLRRTQLSSIGILITFSFLCFIFIFQNDLDGSNSLHPYINIHLDAHLDVHPEHTHSNAHAHLQSESEDAGEDDPNRIKSGEYLLRALHSVKGRLRKGPTKGVGMGMGEGETGTALYKDKESLPKSWISGKDRFKTVQEVVEGEHGSRGSGRDGEFEGERDTEGGRGKEEDSSRSNSVYGQDGDVPLVRNKSNSRSLLSLWHVGLNWLSSRFHRPSSPLTSGRKNRLGFSRDSSRFRPRPHSQTAWTKQSTMTSWDTLDPVIKEFREWEYSRSLLYQGTGERVMRFLEKARAGGEKKNKKQGFTVSVVGGSVSKGRGLPVIKSFDLDLDLNHNGQQAVRGEQDDSDLREYSQTGKQKRSLASDFHIDSSASTSQNLYHPLNLHHQIFQFLNSSFPAPSHTSYHPMKKPLDEEIIGKNKPTQVDNHPIPRNTFINGAQGGVGSDYFAGCWKEHIPEDSDLVLVELGINDERNLEAMENFELLLRSLMEMKSQPAIIIVQTFTLLFPTLSQASSIQLDVAAYYDVPVISLRDVLLPRILNDPSMQKTTKQANAQYTRVGDEIRKWFRNVDPVHVTPGDAKVVDGVDLMHISHHGHTLLSDLVIHYLELQMQKLMPYNAYLFSEDQTSTRPGISRMSHSTDIPAMLLASQYDPNKRMRRDNPSCRSTNSFFTERRMVGPNDGKNQNSSSGSESEMRSVVGPEHGWHLWNWGEKRYIRSRFPGSRISIPFEIQAEPSHSPPSSSIYDRWQGEGYLKIGFQRSKTLGLGSVDCWVESGAPVDRKQMRQRRFPRRSSERERGTEMEDTDTKANTALVTETRLAEFNQAQIEGRTRLDGHWDIKERNKVVMSTIRSDLLPGHHIVHCEVLEETADPGGSTEFRLVAVVHN